MELADQIRKKFANLTSGKASKLEGFPEEMSSWTIKMRSSYAVGFEIDENVKVNESFANVSFYTDWFKVGSEEKYLLLLASDDEQLRNEFAGICALFLEAGPNGEMRKELINNPIQWWKNWKNLIGNKNVENSVHGVLGELVTLYYIKKTVVLDLTAENWTGPKGNSFDIQTQNKNFEVKSTLIKYNNIVTISGQYQLNPNSDLSLIFVKFEEPGKGSGGTGLISIDSMLEMLAELGMDYSTLNKNVSKLGYKENSLDRKKVFRILEIRKYPVDDNFPYINIDKLSNVNKREHIIQISYKIDLNGIDYEPVQLDIM